MASSTTSPANPSGLSDACCDPGAGALSGRPTHLTGKEVTIAGIPCYSVGDTGGPCDVVIVATDVFGWRFDNNRVVADEVAAGGFHVVIPDLFEGDSVTMEQLKGGRAYIRGVWSAKTCPVLVSVDRRPPACLTVSPSLCCVGGPSTCRRRRRPSWHRWPRN